MGYLLELPTKAALLLLLVTRRVKSINEMVQLPSGIMPGKPGKGLTQSLSATGPGTPGNQITVLY